MTLGLAAHFIWPTVLRKAMWNSFHLHWPEGFGLLGSMYTLLFDGGQRVVLDGESWSFRQVGIPGRIDLQKLWAAAPSRSLRDFSYSCGLGSEAASQTCRFLLFPPNC